jgi:hypothetical protein
MGIAEVKTYVSCESFEVFCLAGLRKSLQPAALLRGFSPSSQDMESFHSTDT